MVCRASHENEKESAFHRNLKKFPKISESLIDEATRLFSTATMHYTIKDNKIYGRRLGSVTDFRMFTDFFLLHLQRQVRLPDSEFVFNLGDYPVATRDREHIPIFSWCGKADSSDLLLPTYSMVYWTRRSSVEDLHESDGKSFSVADWDQKIEKLVWRGRDSSHERLSLVEMGNKEKGGREEKDFDEKGDVPTGWKPKDKRLLDVGLTRYFFFKDRKEELGTVDHMRFIDFWKYKYILSMDGTVAAYRLGALLAGNSVIFKQESPYFEHYYHLLEPFVHYIPVARDLSDLEERVLWAKENDYVVRNITRNARELTRHFLRPEDVWCDIYESLLSYSEKLTFEPRIHPDMEEVTQANGIPEARPCSCNQKPEKEMGMSDEL
eukprot:TRINITY_DN6873_c0_g1_i2.p1 TRINITY_DN6873_c0_g1~~TRINITY_DN6873_c0_g1_i2.p1  ORF type:complete len:380 (+),score=65.91 TRINITY_DN6873_c0_g1_i2:571-1710(+)